MATAEKSSSRRRPSPRPARESGGGRAREGGDGGASGVSELPPHELVVVARPEAGLRATRDGVASDRGADVAPLAEALADEGVVLIPMFGSEERLRMAAATAVADTGQEIPDLASFYKIEAPEDRLYALAERLQELDQVEAAFVKPPAEPAQALNDMVPAADEAPPASPDFSSKQGYLNAAPGGVDAKYAWTRPGGTGKNVQIIDIEGAWRFTHEDLLLIQGGVVGGTQSADLGWRNHGTAVLGEFSGDKNAFGITGICPDAKAMAISIFGAGSGSSQAIVNAANKLSPGDIILIELHRPGPRFNFTAPQGQRGFIAIEWWPDDLAAIRFAVSKGVIVVEAAGNGFENLDDPLYDTPGPGFPATWRNPFRRSPVDSGAIVVGAGAPPSGSFGPDRSRLDFSNFGSMVDAQGWGREVVTCGYGDLQGGSNENFWYTAQFSGTSSASPIVVGALGCLQGFHRATGSPPRTPAQARALLRATGSPQQDAPGRPRTQRIGNRPNLRRLIPKGKELKELKEFKEFKEKDFKELKELGKEIETKRKELDKIKDSKEFELSPGAGAASSLDARLAQVEQTVAQLSHFIGGELRPDLGSSALGGEDQAELSRQLEKQASDAKQAKDNKDVEKPRDF